MIEEWHQDVLAILQSHAGETGTSEGAVDVAHRLSGAWRAIHDNQVVEQLAAAAHDGWMNGKLEQGVTSRLSEWGEEFMVPYSALSERAKELDRAAVRSVVDNLRQLVKGSEASC